ncbi:MAG: lysozyme inhibitor LprI family protein [Pseudomonadota bacterium]
MAALIFAGALFLATINMPTHAQDMDCTSPQTQMAMNVCSGRDAETADAVLNDVWSNLRAKTRAFDADANIPEGERISDQLLAAQRAWIQYRDGQCNAEGAQYYGGSIRPLIVNTCITRMTEARTQELRTMLQEN